MATKSGGSKSKSKAKGKRKSPAANRSEKSVQAFRDALEKNLNLSRERIEEVVDDAVERGRMTRSDANELVSKLVGRSRTATDDLLRDLERLLEQARKEVESRTASSRRRATRTAERVGRGVRDAADRPLAEADKLRRRAGAPGAPITGYDQLTASQIRARLADLSPAELRRVRTQETRGKARKGVLGDIDKRLAK